MFYAIAEIRAEYGIGATDASDAAISGAIADALFDVRARIVEADYDIVRNAPIDDESMKVIAIRTAHKYFVRYRLAGNFAGWRQGGKVLQERDENGAVTNTYATPQQIAVERAGFFADAEKLLLPYSSQRENGDAPSATRKTTQVPIEYVF